RNVNITNVQNVTVVQPIARVKNTRVTGLAQLANIRAGAAPINRQIRVETVRKEQIATERKQAERFRAISQQRSTTETKLAARARANSIPAPVKAKVTLPPSVAPPRVIRPPVTPPARPAPAPKVDTRRLTQPVKPVQPTAPKLKPVTPVPTPPKVAPRP